MKKYQRITVAATFFGLVFSSGAVLASISKNKNVEKADAHAYVTLDDLKNNYKNINLNDATPETIKAYYDDVTGYQGTELLGQLKKLLQKNQVYFSYESKEALWALYEITDRDWKKSPATDISGFDPVSNTITNYQYSVNADDIAIHALYVNRNVDNPMTAGEHIDLAVGINQEHVWAKSHGFEDRGQGGARGDPMHLIAGNARVNQTEHNNNFFGYIDETKNYTTPDVGANKEKYAHLSGNYSGVSKTYGECYSEASKQDVSVFEPQDSDKGDIARAIFYLAARYNRFYMEEEEEFDANNPNLELVNDLSIWQKSGYQSDASRTGKMGILTDLLAWNRLDPPDEYEIHRNNILFNNYTNNRNPFIDYPEWAEYIWGYATYDGREFVNYDDSPTGVANPNTDTINDFSEGGGGGGGDVSVTGITLNRTEATLLNGSTLALSATVKPGNATNKSVTWSSSNENIATVNTFGSVSGIGVGSATITATTVDGGFTASCNVTVSNSINEKVSIKYTDTFNPTFPTTYSSVHDTDTLHTDETSKIDFKEQGIYQNSNPYLMFYANKGFLYNTQDLGTISSVTLKYDSGVAAGAKVGVYFGDTPQNTYATSENKTRTGDPNYSDTFDNSTDGYGYFQVSTSGSNVRIQEIEINYVVTAKTLTGIELSNAGPTSFRENDEFEFSGTVTALYDDGSSEDVTSECEFTGYDLSVVGNQTVTVSYLGKTATYGISVIASDKYKLSTDISDIVEGAKIVFVCEEYNMIASPFTTYTNMLAKDTTIVDHTIEDVSNAQVYTVGIDGNGYYFTTEEDKYLASTGSSTGITLKTVMDNYTYWTVDYDEGVWRIQNKGFTDNRNIRFYNYTSPSGTTTPRFAYYRTNTTDQKNISVYVLNPENISDQSRIDAFAFNYMRKAETLPSTDTGACKGEEGYFAKARAALEGKWATVASIFGKDTSGMWERYVAWGKANEFDVTYSANTISYDAIEVMEFTSNNNDTSIILILVISVLSFTSLVTLLVIKKRKRV